MSEGRYLIVRPTRMYGSAAHAPRPRRPAFNVAALNPDAWTAPVVEIGASPVVGSGGPVLVVCGGRFSAMPRLFAALAQHLLPQTELPYRKVDERPRVGRSDKPRILGVVSHHAADCRKL